MTNSQAREQAERILRMNAFLAFPDLVDPPETLEETERALTVILDRLGHLRTEDDPSLEVAAERIRKEVAQRFVQHKRRLNFKKLLDVTRHILESRRVAAVLLPLLIVFACYFASGSAACAYSASPASVTACTPPETLRHVFFYAFVSLCGLLVYGYQCIRAAGQDRVRPILGVVASLLVGADAIGWLRLFWGNPDASYPVSLKMIDIFAYTATVFMLASVIRSTARLRTALFWAIAYFAIIHWFWLELLFRIDFSEDIWRLITSEWQEQNEYRMFFLTIALYGISLGVALRLSRQAGTVPTPTSVAFRIALPRLVLFGLTTIGLFALFSAHVFNDLGQLLLLAPTALALYGLSNAVTRLLQCQLVNVSTPKLRGPWWPAVTGLYCAFLAYMLLGPVTESPFSPWRLVALPPGIWLYMEGKRLGRAVLSTSTSTRFGRSIPMKMILAATFVVLLGGLLTKLPESSQAPAEPSTRSEPPVNRKYATEFKQGLPDDIRELGEDLAKPEGLGGRISAMLRTDTSAALGIVQSNLSDWPLHGALLQDKTGDSEWRSIALFRADLPSIERGEMDQGRVTKDTGWQENRRKFTMSMDGTDVKLTQIRVKDRFVRQKSKYSWSSWGFYGRGTDWLLPIVGEDGQISAYLVYSVYESNYKDPGSEQRSDVAAWKRNAERRSGN